MTAATGQAETPATARGRLSVADLVLLRVAAGGASRADLQRDLAHLVAPEIPGTKFRQAAESAIADHVAKGHITETRSRLTPRPAAIASATARVAPAPCDFADWPSVITALILRALSLAAPPPGLGKALQRPEGLAALVLQEHFALGMRKILSPATLRAELAVIALERAFGNRIKTGFGKGQGLPGKAARILAGQLFRQPCEMTADGKLVVALAGEVLATRDLTVEGFKRALLRRIAPTAPSSESGRTDPAKSAERKAPRSAPRPDNDAEPMSAAPAVATPRPRRPDMQEFAGAVVAAARPVAEGWSGNRKAFISLVWNAIRKTRPEWELTEIAFKGMLAEAHRTGYVVLAGADLKVKCDLKELEDSKILYKNTVWHFVRVED